MARPDLVEAGPQGLDLDNRKRAEGQRLQLVRNGEHASGQSDANGQTKNRKGRFYLGSGLPDGRP
jgi:hypothetical protein